MKAKLIVEGKEFPIEIQDPELEKLLKPKKKTGYERVEEGELHYYDDGTRVEGDTDRHEVCDDQFYEVANYYSDITVAENNARADKLMRQLRRLSVEHRDDVVYWCKGAVEKWSVIYDYTNNRLMPDNHWEWREAFAIYFETKEVANLAIETFHDELIWYFTEYKDSL